MHKYRVVERWPDGSRIELRCQTGRYHVARVLSGTPAANATLIGDKPHLGFGLLACSLSGRIFRVIFEFISRPGLSLGRQGLANEAGLAGGGGFGWDRPTSTRH